MRIGCACFGFAEGYAAPFEPGIEKAAELGYEGVELMVANREDLQDYYTDSRIASLGEMLARHRLVLSQFIVNNALLGGLSRYEHGEREQAFKNFVSACKIASSLGTSIIGTVSNWPCELSAPVKYLPSYIYPSAAGSAKFNPKLSMELSGGFSWERAWNNYMQGVSVCAAAAADFGLSLAIESHPLCFISSTDSYLRMFEQVDAGNLGANLDTGFPLKQREYVPIAIHKLRGRLLHMHLRDGDGLYSSNLIPGSGVIDWQEVKSALDEIGYNGFVSVELSGYADPYRYFGESLRYLKTVFEETYK